MARTESGAGTRRNRGARRYGAPWRRRPAGAGGHAYAALDLGTNNCRLLIAEPADEGFRVIDAFSRIVRLGEGLEIQGVLSDAAMKRTVDALRVCAGKMRRRGVVRARSVATHACRRAANCDAFLERVAEETGIALEIISAGEEAHLAVAGCLPLVDADARWALVLDIGGGSTELIWVGCADGGHQVAGWTSLPCGVVTLAEAHGTDRVERDVYEAMVARVGALLDPFEAEHGVGREIAAGNVQMLGASGTVTTVAGVHLGLVRYDRAAVDGYRLDFSDVDAVADRLLRLDRAARAAIPTIGPERADLVIAGCAVLDAIQRAWPVGRLRVADRGIREGMLTAMMHADAHGGGAYLCIPGAARRAPPVS